MKLSKSIAAIASAFTIALTMSGCVASAGNNEINDGDSDLSQSLPEVQPPAEQLPEEQLPSQQPSQQPEEVQPSQPQPSETQPNEPQQPSEENPTEEEPPAKPQTPAVVQPQIKKVSYIKVTAENVNIRSGAGTNYSVTGTAEKSTLYANLGEANGFYKTRYKNKTAYISKRYCSVIEFTASENEKVEAVIDEGTKLLGTRYVYGAVRLHDGNGNMCKGFTVSEFDCSSLMQYIFYKGAGKLLQVNTRTQIYQGTTVSKSKLQRGDLIFFTNASRKNNKGIERVGHVALYLGDNYILHTASDYAKIEQISATRWSYYIQAQRMI